jgi:hypothetical protein
LALTVLLMMVVLLCTDNLVNNVSQSHTPIPMFLWLSFLALFHFWGELTREKGGERDGPPSLTRLHHFCLLVACVLFASFANAAVVSLGSVQAWGALPHWARRYARQQHGWHMVPQSGGEWQVCRQTSCMQVVSQSVSRSQPFGHHHQSVLAFSLQSILKLVSVMTTMRSLVL